MKLSSKIILSFLSIIIFSILLTSYVSITRIYSEFKLFLLDEQNDKLEQIADNINNSFSNNNYIINTSEIDNLALSNNVSISIKNLNNNIVYDFSTTNQRHNQHKNNHGNNMNSKNYITEDFSLLRDYKRIGTISLTFFNNNHLSQNAMLFTKSLNRSFFISGFFSILVSLILAIFISKSLVNPISKITDSAKSIENGDFNINWNFEKSSLEIDELAKSIEHLAYSLHREELLRKEYAQDISHELRTPLTTIKGYLETIIDGIWEPSEDKLNIILQETDRLSILIEKLRKSFLLNTSESINNLETLNLKKELDNIINLYKPMFIKKNIILSISCKENIYLNINKEDFYQIVTNIISNSLKYLPELNPKLDIKIENSNNYIYIIIQDNGLGIDEQNIPLLFNRLYKIDSSRNNSTGGSGLGLSIVKNLIDKYKGEIYIESKLNIGTKITIKL